MIRVLSRRMKRQATREFVPNNESLMFFNVEEFVRTLKYGTLLHHHGAIDRIVHEFMCTRNYEQVTPHSNALTGILSVAMG